MTRDEARRAVRLAAILTLLLCVAGIFGITLVAKYELWKRSIFYEQFAAIEAPGIAIIAAFAFAVLVFTMRPAADEPLAVPVWLRDTPRTRWLVVLGVLAITAAGTWMVFHAYLFVDDEFSGSFQGVIYANAQRVAPVGEPWCRWIGALTPTSIGVPATCTWKLSYFPVNALIRGVFFAARLEWLANPVMAALSVALVFQIARRAWPERPQRAMTAAIMLAASSQFLLMSMSGFSMTAHLLAATAWLWLYLRPERWALLLLPWLGVIALGVHSPYPHVLFVTPFVLGYLIQRRYAAFAYLSVVYAAGALAWVGRIYPAPTPVGTPGVAAGMIATSTSSRVMHPVGDGATASMSLTVLATWSVPLALLAMLAAVLLWQRLDRFSRLLAVSLVGTIFVRAIFFGTYGAGWGHRYAFATLANLALLAAIGFEAIGDAVGARPARRLLSAAFLTAVLVQLPMRGIQASRIVRPYREASEYLETIPADVVIVQFDALQWGRQLLRNDPFLRNSPKLMGYSELRKSGVDSISALFPGRVRVVSPAEIERFGVKRAARIGRFEIR